MRTLAVALVCMLAMACTAIQQPQSASSGATSSPTPVLSAAPSSSPSLLPPGPLDLSLSVVAQGLQVPWALAFFTDGSLWLTERPGRVRVIRSGQLLPDPALSLAVVSQPGCEGGLLGLALQDPYAFLVYTHRGPAGNVNRVSRFTIQKDHLVGEQVLLDDIPGGTCYHFGGRLLLGPDGLLYLTTGEGFVAARAADPNALSGKILRLRPQGGPPEIFAWGFRNPEGLAFDAQGRLYASNNGPSGDLGLCCHDEVDLVHQGAFYGWPAWAGNVRTSFPQGSLPARVPPLAESGNDTWAPSGMTFYSPRPSERPTLLVTELKGQALRRLLLDPSNPGKLVDQQVVLTGQGRLRDVQVGPDRCLYVLTSNRDGRGFPRPGDDRVLRLCPRWAG